MENTPKHGIKPEAITKPAQLAAALLAGAAFMVVVFLGAGLKVSQPPWAAGVLLGAAVFVGLAGLFGGYRLLTKYRENIQDDAHFAKGQAEKRKALERRVKEQKEQLDQHEKLAEQRLAVTVEYFEVVARQLQLPDLERLRLQRALRETMRAGEDRALQEQAKHLLLETDEVFAHARAAEPALMTAVLDRMVAARYDHLNSVYTDFVREDVRPVDLASELTRVSSVVLENRARIEMPSPPVMVRATAGILEVVLSEVFINAREYSPVDSPIRVEVSRVPQAVLVIVHNALRPGDVVSETWFEPGIRGGASGEAFPSGAGLGLPLVRRLLSLIDGNAAIAQDAAGARLTLTFREA